jgi:hypothetical protein
VKEERRRACAINSKNKKGHVIKKEEKRRLI